jgi:predicted ATPase
MRRGITIYRQQGMAYLVPSLESALAESEARAGETDAGLRRLGDALAELARTEQRWYEAEMHRIRAEILMQRDPANTMAVEQSLQAASLSRSRKKRAALNCAPRCLWRSFIAPPIVTSMPMPCWPRRPRASRRPNNSPNSPRR